MLVWANGGLLVLAVLAMWDAARFRKRCHDLDGEVTEQADKIEQLRRYHIVNRAQEGVLEAGYRLASLLDMGDRVPAAEGDTALEEFWRAHSSYHARLEAVAKANRADTGSLELGTAAPETTLLDVPETTVLGVQR